MPPKVKITREDILATAIRIIRRDGAEACNARSVAVALHCSTQPVFSNFSSMADLRQAVIERAYEIYLTQQKEAMSKGDFPPYKASGMAYIRFAQEERHLFRLLFMRDRKAEDIGLPNPELQAMSSLVQGQLALSPDDARFFHLEMWVYVHGIASMIATDFLPWDWGLISRMLTDQYQAMAKQYAHKE
ncbi:MAG: TetR/AcrR family transcriptional regulator [Clostridia bacterium]|nr:TetR/AcrR family transcriptional regulator [Clostridia bacterium]MBR4359961.1 TetR/AcrR family transcriptional regulator [Clostridia bacterium]